MDNERDLMERYEDIDCFMRKYKPSQLEMFWDMMEKMIQSKNYQIYEHIQ